MNDNLILISGKSSTGKSLSLRNLKNPEGVLYLNCENNKKLPFKSKFIEKTITDPYHVYDGFAYAETKVEIHTIVVDTLTYLMDMFESVHVLPSTNTMQMWGQYAQFMKNLMAQHVAKSTKNVIFLAHTMDILNEKEQSMETLVKVKGSLMNQGIESFFSNVISTKKVPLTSTEQYKSDLLTISDDEEMTGIKYVYQTKITKDTINERIRGPLDMWNKKETYIDNDAQLVLDRLHEYYS